MVRQARLHALALSVALACLPALATQRAFVSSTGNDANAPSGCTLALPCRSFQAAHGAVDAGGEIVALDTAGFGAVTISKSVAIIGNPGTIPSIAVASGAGVTIATAGVNVILRNLNLNGTGGSAGIDMSDGNSLSIENCVVSNFTNNGVFVFATTPLRVRITESIMRGNGNGAYLAGLVNADIVGSQFMGNAAAGLYVESGVEGSGEASVAVNDSVASGNAIGFFLWGYSLVTPRMSLIRSTASNNSGHGFLNRAESASGNSVMIVGSSMASGNGTGFGNLALDGGNAFFESLGSNIVRQNAVASAGTITPVSGL